MKVKLSFKLEVSVNGCDYDINYFVNDSIVTKEVYYTLINLYSSDNSNKKEDRDIVNKSMDNAYNIGYYDGQIDLSNSYNKTISENKILINSLKNKAVKEFKDYLK